MRSRISRIREWELEVVCLNQHLSLLLSRPSFFPFLSFFPLFFSPLICLHSFFSVLYLSLLLFPSLSHHLFGSILLRSFQGNQTSETNNVNEWTNVTNTHCFRTLFLSLFSCYLYSVLFHRSFYFLINNERGKEREWERKSNTKKEETEKFCPRIYFVYNL